MNLKLKIRSYETNSENAIDLKVNVPIKNINKPTNAELQLLGMIVLKYNNQRVNISPYTPQANNELDINDILKQLK